MIFGDSIVGETDRCLDSEITPIVKFFLVFRSSCIGKISSMTYLS